MVELLGNLDGDILLWIQEFVRNPICTPFFKFITHLGDAGVLWIAICILLLISRKTRKVGILCIIAILATFIVNNLILKNLVARIRPYEVVNGLNILIARPKDLSFPSGHAAISFAVAATIYQCLPKNKKTYGIALLVLSSLIALSRLYVGVHYPTDVITGILTGTLISIFVVKIGKKYSVLDNIKFLN